MPKDEKKPVKPFPADTDGLLANSDRFMQGGSKSTEAPSMPSLLNITAEHRRQRLTIATSVLAALLTRTQGTPSAKAREAIQFADALLGELGKE